MDRRVPGDLTGRLTNRIAGGLALLALALGLAACAGRVPAQDLRAAGDRHLEVGEYEAAANAYGQIVDRYPGDWQAQAMLGRSCIELQRYPQARRSLEVACSLRPRDAEIADALAEVMYRQGDEDRLFTFLRDRTERMQTVHAYLRQARYSMLIGDFDTAKIALDTALAFDGRTTVEPIFMAAEFAQQIGDPDMAIRRLRAAYAIDPADPRVSARLAELGASPGPTIAGRVGR